MKRILSLLLTAALAAALFTTPAFAASAAQPWLQVDGVGTASQTITIRGLSGSFDAVQVTLTLNKDVDTVQFEFGQFVTGMDSTHSVSIPEQDGNSLTLYVASNNQINVGDSIWLGTLSGVEAFKVESASSLKLLNMDQSQDPNGVGSSFENVSMSPPSSKPNPPGTGYPDYPDYPDIGTDDPNPGTTTPGSGTTTPGSGTAPFTDVNPADWFYDSVRYVYNKGLMNGTSPTAFGPYQTTTRAMIVTILYRCEGSPAAGASAFRDVPAGQYYTAPVAWAAQNGVVNGYSSTQFGPNDTITREQMAAILYRYAQYKGYSVSGRADLSVYADGNRVSAYARDAMAWANQAKLINGVDQRTLDPAGSATRAQVATILARFCQTIGQ